MSKEASFAEPQALVVSGNTLITEQMDGNIIKAITTHAGVLKGRSVSMDMMYRTLRNAVVKNPLIAEDYRALLEALTHCCRVGLVPDGKEAALVPYRNKKTGKMAAQFIPMIYGILKQVRKAMKGVSIYAECVYEHDEFDHELGTNPMLYHKANLDVPRVGAKKGENEIKAVYAVAKYPDNPVPEVVLLGRADIEYYRTTFSKDTRPGNIWEKHYPEMAKKTALRQLCKRMPMADENVGDIFGYDAEDEDFGRRDDFDNDVEAHDPSVIHGTATEVTDDAPEPEAKPKAPAKTKAQTKPKAPAKGKAAAKKKPPAKQEDEPPGEDEDVYDTDEGGDEGQGDVSAEAETKPDPTTDEDFEDDIPF